MTSGATNKPHGLLLLHLSSLDASLDEAFHCVSKSLTLVHRLTIALSVPVLGRSGRNGANKDSSIDSDGGSQINNEGNTFHNIQKILSALYVNFTQLAVAMHRPLTELDIVFYDWCGYDIGVGSDDIVPFDILLGTSNVVASLKKINDQRTQKGHQPLPVVNLQWTPETAQVDTHIVDAIDSAVAHYSVTEGQYRNVALGGTFDHLHAGHKILLSMTAWIASERVVCGVTDDSMLATKKFKEYLESLDTRIASVSQFLNTFKRGLRYEVVPISDIYGPTITDDNLQALMVSKETMKGGAAVNQERVNRKLPPLAIEVINVISPTETEADEISLKISSTYIRQYLAQQQQQQQRPAP
ncbi:hypothetical protein DFQ27_004871 [Actinomortierella ambigua]|uniref:Cytidyltransferase-like domain-containing protein n=1 Tax=Actinomortierella ambigua TaxID=1343610 RepID=A0A9P6Q0P9_9FUNG|nr:hypothetical protein DFQ27_004871 [Actinomortierella ambigua]